MRVGCLQLTVYCWQLVGWFLGVLLSRRSASRGAWAEFVLPSQVSFALLLDTFMFRSSTETLEVTVSEFSNLLSVRPDCNRELLTQ